MTGQLEASAVQNEQCRLKRLAATDYRNAAGCALLVGILLLIIHAGSNEPFMDDFSYAKTAQQFAATGRFIFNGWAVETLGWQVLWGALFIKLFGFSFRILQLSIIPLAMSCAYLSHQIFRKFGLTPGNSLLGTFTLTLSPLFLPVAASYMTDIPGLLVILVCIRMCQRAAESESARGAILWLVAASVVNLIGGTARQIAWLGALIMVPSTAWMLRRWRGIKTTGLLLFFLAYFTVLGVIHWFNGQPYSVPEPIYQGPIHGRMLLHAAVQTVKAAFCLMLMVIPLLAAWIPASRNLGAKKRVLAFTIPLLTTAILLAAAVRGSDGVLAPWLKPLIEAQAFAIPILPGMSLHKSLLVMDAFLTLFVFFEISCCLGVLADHSEATYKSFHSWKKSEIFWILGPFALAYIALLLPRGIYSWIQDRYILGLLPVAIVGLALLSQRIINARFSKISALTLVLFSAYSVAGARSFYLASAALHRLLDRMERAGIPRMAIETTIGAGIANDGWAQIEHGGLINDPRIVNPPHQYRVVTRDDALPGYCQYWFTDYTPDIAAEYYIVPAPMACFAPTNITPEYYHAWLPPFRRALYVEQRRPVQPLAAP